MAVIGRLKAAACLTNDCNSVNNSIPRKGKYCKTHLRCTCGCCTTGLSLSPGTQRTLPCGRSTRTKLDCGGKHPHLIAYRLTAQVTDWYNLEGEWSWGEYNQKKIYESLWLTPREPDVVANAVNMNCGGRLGCNGRRTRSQGLIRKQIV